MTPARDRLRDVPEGAFLAGAGSSIQLERRADATDAWRIGDRILLPYVHPADGRPDHNSGGR
jgi:hypothetical protein